MYFGAEMSLSTGVSFVTVNKGFRMPKTQLKKSPLISGLFNFNAENSETVALAAWAFSWRQTFKAAQQFFFSHLFHLGNIS